MQGFGRPPLCLLLLSSAYVVSSIFVHVVIFFWCYLDWRFCHFRSATQAATK